MDKFNETLPTNKIKIKARLMTDTEKEVELPYFAKYGTGAFYKVISERKTITAEIWEMTSTSISVINYGYAHPEAVPCTEQEFNEAFQTALSKIQNL